MSEMLNTPDVLLAEIRSICEEWSKQTAHEGDRFGEVLQVADTLVNRFTNLDFNMRTSRPPREWAAAMAYPPRDTANLDVVIAKALLQAALERLA